MAYFNNNQNEDLIPLCVKMIHRVRIPSSQHESLVVYILGNSKYKIFIVGQQGTSILEQSVEHVFILKSYDV